jgi:nucleotide-binding universal stress UspA family protein
MAMSLDYGGMVPPVPAGTEMETVSMWKEELAQFVDPLTRDAGEVEVTTLVKERVNIREAILDHVAEVNADLVVLGTRGKSGLKELLIGTTAEKIIQNAPCAILAVKPDEIVMGVE